MKPLDTMMNRRSMLAGTGTLFGFSIVPEWLVAQQVPAGSQVSKPGEFSWNPDASPEGPVAIVVSIPDQRVHVYRNGVRIGLSTCSTGKAGHGTPTGVFCILQKDAHHRSSTYNNAPMPNMNRLTWSGIALHAGQLPGYPASHGCVRLPLEFSRLLFTVTHVGTPVIIADNHSDPVQIVHPGNVLDPVAEAKLDHVASKKPPTQVALKSRPAQTHVDNKVPPIAIVVSSADKRMIVFENGHIIAEGQSTIQNAERPLGQHVFVLSRANDGHMYWHGIGHRANLAAQASDLLTLERIGTPESVSKAITGKLHVGATLTTVDTLLTADTRSGRDFLVMGDHDHG